jgi:hypothetical protein
VATLKLPNGNVGIVLANGDVSDPAFLTAKGLTRLSDADLQGVFAWVAAERENRAKHVAQVEGAAAAHVEAERERMEHRHAAQAKWAKEKRL